MNISLTEGKISSVLVRMTIPMIFGMFSIMAFNLTDVYFISIIGTNELSAMTFTFPVVMVIGSIAMGLSVGVSTVVSSAIGKGDSHKVKRLTTDTMILSGILVIFFSLIGLLTIKPLFLWMGAPLDIIPLIKEYMIPWYIGVIFIVIPMVGNGAIRATGDTKIPGLIMTFAAVVNVILDPIFIFGFGPIPAMGLHGAAIASLTARAFSLIASLYILSMKKKMIADKIFLPSQLIKSWREVLYISIPTIGSNLLSPITQSVIIKMLASYGKEVVAGVGVVTRIESFALIIPVALSSVMGPFTGQNLGAKNFNRIEKANRQSYQFSLGFGVVLFILLTLFSKNIATLFSKDLIVINTIVIYFKYIAISYAFQMIFFTSSSVLNALKKPIHSTCLQVTKLFIIYIPFALLGKFFFQEKGIFIAYMITNFLSGTIAYFTLTKTLNNIENK